MAKEKILSSDTENPSFEQILEEMNHYKEQLIMAHKMSFAGIVEHCMDIVRKGHR